MADFQMWSALQSAMQDDGRRRSVHRATWRRVAEFARPHRRTIAAFLALATVAALLGVAAPVLAGRAVDAIVDGRAVGVVIGLAVLLALVAVVDAGVGLLERLESSRLGEHLILDLRRTVFEHVQSMPIAFFTRTHTGALVSRLNNDVIGAQRAFTSALAGVVTNVITLVLTLAVMLSLSWQITVLAVVLLPLFVIPARRIGSRVGQLEREATEHNAAMTSQMTERFSAPGATLVKLFGRPRAEAVEFGARAERVSDIGIRSALAMEVFFRSLTLVSGLAQALVYGLGGYLAVRGDLDPGTVVTMALLLTRLYGPLTALGTARLDVVTALVSFERVFEVLDLEPLIAEPASPVALPSGPVGVELTGVRFGYPSADRVSLASLEEVAVLDDRAGDEVLHDVSFRVEPGQTVAIVGPSGAGKSTLVSLVPRLYDPDAGTVRLAGVDVRELSFETIRRTVGVVTQDGHLFHDTVRANLRYAAPDASDDELWAALEQARLAPLVRALADGLDTVVGERGYRLSGGERQRLTIARLLLAKPRVVILDEATAHLDSESEVAVQEALVAALAGRTALVIAHRLSTVRAADAILVVEAGRIVERGTHTELLAAGGRYAELYRTQFSDTDTTDHNVLSFRIRAIGHDPKDRTMIEPGDEGGEAACLANLFADDRPDIRTRQDIEQLVVAFYRDAAMDDLLGPIFAAAEVDWSAHLPKLVDFWAWQLLGQPGYGRNPLRAHEPAHARTPFGDEHYERWLELFETTVDAAFAGPTAELAKGRARRMASALRRLLAGESSAGDEAIEVLPRSAVGGRGG